MAYKLHRDMHTLSIFDFLSYDTSYKDPYDNKVRMSLKSMVACMIMMSISVSTHI